MRRKKAFPNSILSLTWFKLLLELYILKSKHTVDIDVVILVVVKLPVENRRRRGVSLSVLPSIGPTLAAEAEERATLAPTGRTAKGRIGRGGEWGHRLSVLPQCGPAQSIILLIY